MRLLPAVGLLLALFASPSFAQSVRECPEGVRIVGPGSSLPGGSVPAFRWSSEPATTASREIVVFEIANSAAQKVGQSSGSGTGFQLPDGEYGWFVTFKTAAGVPICRTAIASLTIGGTGVVFASTGGLTGSGSSGAVLVKFINAEGRYVIVLRNSRYTGQYTEKIDSEDFNGTSYALNNAIGLEIHGNELRNVVTGSPKSDLIILYDGNDEANGGAGDDTLHGGNGDDMLIDPAGGDIDRVFGGPGADFVNVFDGEGNDFYSAGSIGPGINVLVTNGGDTDVGGEGIF